MSQQQSVINLEKARVGYVATPPRHVSPACRNCGHYTCDAGVKRAKG